MIKIVINIKECLGCGLCSELAPDFFLLKDGKSVVNPKANLEEKKNQEIVRETAKACPVGAIKIRT